MARKLDCLVLLVLVVASSAQTSTLGNPGSSFGSTTTFSAVTADEASMRAIFVDSGQDSVYMANDLNNRGRVRRIVASTGALAEVLSPTRNNFKGVAYDWTARTLYFVSGQNNGNYLIRASAKNGATASALVNPEVTLTGTPYKCIVRPTAKLFFVNSAGITSTNSDGTGPQNLALPNLVACTSDNATQVVFAGSSETPARIYSVSASSLSAITSLTLDAADGAVLAGAVDTIADAAGLRYLYFSTAQTPSKIVKLSVTSANVIARVGSHELPTNYNQCGALEVDPVNKVLYVGCPEVAGQSRIALLDLVDFQFRTSLMLSNAGDVLGIAAEPNSRKLFIGTSTVQVAAASLPNCGSRTDCNLCAGDPICGWTGSACVLQGSKPAGAPFSRSCNGPDAVIAKPRPDDGGGAAAAIIIVLLAIGGVVGFHFYKKKKTGRGLEQYFDNTAALATPSAYQPKAEKPVKSPSQAYIVPSGKSALEEDDQAPEIKDVGWVAQNTVVRTTAPAPAPAPRKPQGQPPRPPAPAASASHSNPTGRSALEDDDDDHTPEIRDVEWSAQNHRAAAAPEKPASASAKPSAKPPPVPPQVRAKTAPAPPVLAAEEEEDTHRSSQPETFNLAALLNTNEPDGDRNFSSLLPSYYAYLRQNALKLEGLFRESANQEWIRYWASNLADESGADLGQCTDPHEVAGSIKLYFRELEPPLFPYRMWTPFMKAQNADAQRLDAMKECIGAMPRRNREALSSLMWFIREVLAEKKVNRMDAGALSTVFGPSLLRKKSGFGAVAEVNDIIKFMINNTPDLFPK